MYLAYAGLALLVPSIWIVDAANGPGTHFTDLPAAVAAAQSGDTIVVRAGSYAPFSVSGKALTLRGAGAVGSAGTYVQTGLFTPPSIGTAEIDAVPAGQTFFIDGIGFRPGFSGALFGAMLKIEGASTHVVLADCEVRGYLTNQGDALVVDGAEVHAVRSSFIGGNYVPNAVTGGFGGDGAEVKNGGVLTSDSCTFTGGNGAFVFFPGSIAGQGVRVTAGRAELHRTSMTGGASLVPVGLAAGASGLSASAASVVAVYGSAVDVVRGGLVPPSAGIVGGSGIATDGASTVAVYGPVSVLGGLQGGVATGAPTTGAVTLGLPAAPTLDTFGAAAPAGEIYAGLPVGLTVNSSSPNSSFVLAVSFATSYADFGTPTILGGAVVDLATAMFVDGVLDAAGSATFSFVPLLTPAITEVPLYAQVAVLDTTGVVRLSNCDARVFRVL